MVISCEDVWREISNYLDDEVEPGLRAELEAHLAHCRHCATAVDSLRNVVILYADDRIFELPAGFSQRLHKKLAAEMGKG